MKGALSSHDLPSLLPCFLSLRGIAELANTYASSLWGVCNLCVSKFQVQELHEEEAQWVNYDEDELCVKMQLADGIFETLIRDTVDVLNQISEKQGRVLLV